MPVLPIVHMNGTGRAELLAQRLAAYYAVKAAQAALGDMSPNGRDYYPVPGLLEQAMRQYEHRMADITQIAAELMEEYLALEEGR